MKYNRGDKVRYKDVMGQTGVGVIYLHRTENRVWVDDPEDKGQYRECKVEDVELYHLRKKKAHLPEWL